MKPDFLALLRSLHRHQVEFVIVGGVAAILEGAHITTVDLDIVYSLDESNVERLVNLLRELNARYRDPAGRVIEPTVRRLHENRVNLLETRIGLLDVMQQIGDGWSFDEVRRRSHSVQVGELQLHVLDLESLIESKRAAGREKDLAMLPILASALDLKRSQH